MSGLLKLKRKSKLTNPTERRYIEDSTELEKRYAKYLAGQDKEIKRSDVDADVKSIGDKIESLVKAKNGLEHMMKTYEQQNDSKSAGEVKKQIEDIELESGRLQSLRKRLAAVSGAPMIPGGKVAKALYDYAAVEPSQLDIKAGDLITIIDDENDDWWEGENGGKSGYFPKSYVQILGTDAPPLDRFVKALYDFEGAGENELGIQPGDVVQLISTDGDEWWEGLLRGKVGFFPKLYVEEIVVSPEPPKSPTPTQSRKNKKPAADATPESAVPVSTLDPNAMALIQTLSKGLAKTLFDYEGSGESELSLKQGDIVNVLSVEDPEWWEGELNGKIGFFPKLYVEMLPAKDTAKEMSPAVSPAISKNTALNTSSDQVKGQTRKVKAMHNYAAMSESEVNLKQGDVVKLLSTEDDEWWEGEIDGKVGFFPKNYVVEVNEEQERKVKEETEKREKLEKEKKEKEEKEKKEKEEKEKKDREDREKKEKEEKERKEKEDREKKEKEDKRLAKEREEKEKKEKKEKEKEEKEERKRKEKEEKEARELKEKQEKKEKEEREKREKEEKARKEKEEKESKEKEVKEKEIKEKEIKENPISPRPVSTHSPIQLKSPATKRITSATAPYPSIDIGIQDLKKHIERMETTLATPSSTSSIIASLTQELENTIVSHFQRLQSTGNSNATLDAQMKEMKQMLITSDEKHRKAIAEVSQQRDIEAQKASRFEAEAKILRQRVEKLQSRSKVSRDDFASRITKVRKEIDDNPSRDREKILHAIHLLKSSLVNVDVRDEEEMKALEATVRDLEEISNVQRFPSEDEFWKTF
eukprot:TRINITY_DN265_c0_g7_i2.p1 TRINITY_DN265_c0_g7~~TRINITY_DN265_c0_g7_i2.p1  ORF type:complete len:813 (+),score=293.46 TRINITY_DN265_c0_g7_i2:14-2452(+)